MKQYIQAILALLILVVSVSLAEAITITLAQVQNGVAVVEGNKAAKQATVTWESNNVTQTTKGGSFAFSGSVPADCVGTLSDGVSTIQVVVAGCTTQQGGGVLKTGQMTCWDPADTTAPIDTIICAGTGQDGELQRGAARSYTDNGATITDDATGLEWEKQCNDAVNVGCPVINDVDTPYTWAQAFQKVADLNTANFAGHNDWRLPNINELRSLADYGRFFRAVDPAFNNSLDSFTQMSYWSSTTVQGAPGSAWTVSFDNGEMFDGNKVGPNHVRAVRGP